MNQLLAKVVKTGNTCWKAIYLLVLREGADQRTKEKINGQDSGCKASLETLSGLRGLTSLCVCESLSLV